jgi:hypothetical protein
MTIQGSNRTTTVTEPLPEPALMSADDIQHWPNEEPDVARAHQSKRMKRSDNDHDLNSRRLYRPRLDEYDSYSLCNMDMPAGLVVKDGRWTSHQLQSMILRVLEAPVLKASM